MAAAPENQIRRQRVAWMLDDFEARLEAWRASRKKADCDPNGQYVGRHRTQLGAVGSLLVGSLEVLRDELGGIDMEAEVGEVFSESRHVADASVWMERVWNYYAERFDQRDGDTKLASTVSAADEMVWSCYRPVYEHPRIQALDLPAKPPPLAYVEPEFSPAAKTIDSSVDSDLRPSRAIEALEEVAGDLPMSQLRLPPWCVGAPWWLIFIAHEIGHHLQHELQMIGAFRRAVEKAASEAGAETEDAKRWGRWGEEIFADIVSVLLVGPWALWALIEVERRPQATMTRRRPRYPAALARIRLMAGMLERLGLEPAPFLRGLDLAAPAEARPTYALDEAVVERVIPLIDQSWPGMGKLTKLFRFDVDDFRPRRLIDDWSERLLSDADLKPTAHLDSARQIITGSLAAWSRLGDMASADLQVSASLLAARTTAATVAAAPPGTRSETMPSGENRDPGRRLAKSLMGMAIKKRKRMESGAVEDEGETLPGQNPAGEPPG